MNNPPRADFTCPRDGRGAGKAPDAPIVSDETLASRRNLKQDRPMTSVQALAHVADAALRGRQPVAGLNNNNRNNASLPRAGD
ncbi:hypothetical protein QLQ15_16315 [Lysobacter sp. LF1]|uniref:Uncharacterized protein n=1 Tax=Lysobacter stagni TaxID=3045172 RepID=A0ABT6XK68_9GAMM|nr:hypothetical protein [Lysobacter sp. LF1]MDI9240469.1 hypothetical protein [Lysobacter sp. LF1]